MLFSCYFNINKFLNLEKNFFTLFSKYFSVPAHKSACKWMNKVLKSAGLVSNDKEILHISFTFKVVLCRAFITKDLL